MKSHLIPDPQPLEPRSGSNSVSKMFLEREQAGQSQLHRPTSAGQGEYRQGEFRPSTEMPMRSFLRIVCVR